MKESAAKRRDKGSGRDRDSKAEKPKDPGPEPQDVEMPEEEAVNAAKQPKEMDSVTLDGKSETLSLNRAAESETSSVLSVWFNRHSVKSARVSMVAVVEQVKDDLNVSLKCS